MKRLCVMLPAKDEAVGIGRTVGSILRAGLLPADVYVIDDGSSDGTGNIARSFGVNVARNEKNIGKFQWAQQLDLFAGLLPELEEQIQNKIDPLLRDALSATKSAYESTVDHQPDAPQLFQLVFWLLTSKVFHDREVGKFANFNASSSQFPVLARPF